MGQTPNGLKFPEAADLIKASGTASALADDFRELAQTADAAIAPLTGLPARITAVEESVVEARWYKGELPINTNLANFFSIGTYSVSTSSLSATISGKPADSRFNGPFKITVTRISAENGIYQMTIEAKVSGSTRVVSYTQSSLSNAYLGWELTNLDARWSKGALTTGQDLNTIVDEGRRWANTSAVSGSVLSKPAWFTSDPFSVETSTLSSSNGIYQQEATQKITGSPQIRRAYRVSLAGTYLEWQNPDANKPQNKNYTYVTVLGDSQSERSTTSWDVYAGAKLDGTTFINHARSGDESNTILFRDGIKEIICTVNGGVIPASGTVNLSTRMYIQERTDRIIISGSLSGVEGYITYVSPGNLTFTRSDTGPSVNVSGFATFKATWGQEGSAPTAAHALLAWFGGNDFNYGAVGAERNTADHVIGNYRRFVEFAQSNGYRPIIAGVTNRLSAGAGSDGFAQVQRVNRELRRMFPDIFMDIQAYYSERCIYDAGLTPNTADLDAIKRGEIPPQLMLADGIHLTPLAHQTIGEKWIAPWLAANGYARTTIAQPALPPLSPVDARGPDATKKDTGWVDAKPYLINGATATAIFLRRVDDTVLIRVNTANFPNAVNALNLPVGFASTGSNFKYGVTNFGINNSRQLYCSGFTTSGSYYDLITYFVTDPFPEDLLIQS